MGEEMRRIEAINVSASATILEQVALGFGYQAVFGSASSQIHLNMSGLFEPGVNERSFLMRAENLLLLAICIVLRATEIYESTGGTTGQAVLDLRSEISNAFPNSYAMSVLGASEVGDIVHVFDAPDIFALWF